MITPEDPPGWYNEETGQWDKDVPDLPTFMKQSGGQERVESASDSALVDAIQKLADDLWAQGDRCTRRRSYVEGVVLRRTAISIRSVLARLGHGELP